MKTIIVERKDYWDGVCKKYRSTDEQVRENQRENQLQRQRDERARSESLGQQNGNPGQRIVDNLEGPTR